MNRRSKHILAAWILLGAASAGAETLPVSGVYPAQNDAAAELRTIGIEPFGGADGQTVGLLVGDRLRGVQIDGQPYFRVVPADGATRAQAVLQGSAAAELTRRDAEPREKEVCVERNDKDKCVRKEKRKIPCWDAVARLVPTIRLVGRDEFRVMESRQGLAEGDDDAFKEAVRLTKRDRAAACSAWAALEPRNPDHASLLFDLGLCAESEGRLEEAADYYRRAVAGGGDASYAKDGLDRLAARARAEAQLKAHGST